MHEGIAPSGVLESGEQTRVELLRPRWYALYTCPRHEKRVAVHLRNSEIDCFLPLYQALHRWSDRRVKVELPLFPGYIFVRVAYRDRLRVLETPSAVRLVSFNGRPTPLPDPEIEILRSGLAGQRLRAEPHPYLAVGRRVRVKTGRFQGLEGILKRKKGNCRLVLSIDLIMRSIVLDIDGAEVEPLN